MGLTVTYPAAPGAVDCGADHGDPLATAGTTRETKPDCWPVEENEKTRVFAPDPAVTDPGETDTTYGGGALPPGAAATKTPPSAAAPKTTANKRFLRARNARSQCPAAKPRDSLCPDGAGSAPPCRKSRSSCTPDHSPRDCHPCQLARSYELVSLPGERRAAGRSWRQGDP